MLLIIAQMLFFLATPQEYSRHEIKTHTPTISVESAIQSWATDSWDQVRFDFRRLAEQVDFDIARPHLIKALQADEVKLRAYALMALTNSFRHRHVSGPGQPIELSPKPQFLLQNDQPFWDFIVQQLADDEKRWNWSLGYSTLLSWGKHAKPSLYRALASDDEQLRSSAFHILIATSFNEFHPAALPCLDKLCFEYKPREFWNRQTPTYFDRHKWLTHHAHALADVLTRWLLSEDGRRRAFAAIAFASHRWNTHQKLIVEILADELKDDHRRWTAISAADALLKMGAVALPYLKDLTLTDPQQKDFVATIIWDIESPPKTKNDLARRTLKHKHLREVSIREHDPFYQWISNLYYPYNCFLGPDGEQFSQWSDRWVHNHMPWEKITLSCPCGSKRCDARLRRAANDFRKPCPVNKRQTQAH